MNTKPKQVEKTKFIYIEAAKFYSHGYKYDDGSIKGWIISRHGGEQYQHIHDLKLAKLGIEIVTTSKDGYFAKSDFCETVDKIVIKL